MSQPQKTHRKAIAWLEQFAQHLDTDPDIIDAMPIDEVRAKLRTLGADVEGFHTKLAETLNESKSINDPATLQAFIADELWEPQYVGQLVAAADIPKQRHSFSTKYGDINIECSWGEQHQGEPAYIWLSWKANIRADNELWLRFVDPETQTIRHEVNLGTIRAGEETFTSHELGFDPSTERWAISVIG